MNEKLYLESVFDLEIATWLLPKYLPLHPQVGPFYPERELLTNIVGCGKIVSRCKTALSKLNKISIDNLLSIHPNIRSIVFSLNKWMVGMNEFLCDLQRCIQPSSCIISVIEKLKVNSLKWNEVLYKEWLIKWGVMDYSSDESSHSESESL